MAKVSSLSLLSTIQKDEIDDGQKRCLCSTDNISRKEATVFYDVSLHISATLKCNLISRQRAGNGQECDCPGDQASFFRSTLLICLQRHLKDAVKCSDPTERFQMNCKVTSSSCTTTLTMKEGFLTKSILPMSVKVIKLIHRRLLSLMSYPKESEEILRTQISQKSCKGGQEVYLTHSKHRTRFHLTKAPMTDLHVLLESLDSPPSGDWRMIP